MNFPKRLNTLIIPVLLISLFVQSAGYILLFRQVRSEWKRSIAETIRSGAFKDNVTVFTFTSSELQQYERDKGKEILYQGVYYDIFSRTYENGKVTVLCLADTYETKLLHAFLAGFEKNTEASGSPLSFLALLLMNILPGDIYQTEFSIHTVYSETDYAVLIGTQCSSFTGSPDSPPPK